MATPFLIGVTVAGMAYATRFTLRVLQRTKNVQTTSFTASPSLMRTMDEGFASRMTEEEAFMILELPKDATKDMIKNKHKALIIRNHPDKGGSSYLATKINEAKSMLDKQF
ncbi:DnaJ subfamily C member 19 [Tieghemostelium lacteum]|uniref:DnaJ subfamily C member 19 n=1 Tax=Tieghemostelium lacteum TaxID=361077 RepID=A0A151ZDV6_TIELA|nr:DnaJ subfamily C member 19 [Tieghemostelium lacteum]|eukprot:KYQ92074.1 DnaJ subfamily C member 19 [Tieghemostelium lacteum]